MPDEPAAEEVEINVEALTLGQVSVIEEYTGLDKMELLDMLERDLTNLPTRVIIALVACNINPDNPREAIPEVEKMRVADLPSPE